MPNTKSAKKRLRQNEAKRLQNRSAKSRLRLEIRRVHQSVDDGNMEEAETLFRTAARTLDRAGSARLIHPNKAARTKSRLQKLIKKAKAG